MVKINETIEIDGIKIPSYYGKYLANSYEEALTKAKELDFTGGIRQDNEEYGQLFNSKEEFDNLIAGVNFPVAIVPMW